MGTRRPWASIAVEYKRVGDYGVMRGGRADDSPDDAGRTNGPDAYASGPPLLKPVQHMVGRMTSYALAQFAQPGSECPYQLWPNSCAESRPKSLTIVESMMRWP